VNSEPVNTHKISFLSDGLRLEGILHLPDTSRPPVVIGSHGLLSTSSSPKQIELARRCAEHGMAFFRFDHRGCGESEGLFQEVTSLDGRCNDLISAINAVKARKETGNRIGFFGSSMGGAVCLSVASAIDVVSLVTFAAPVRSRKKFELSVDSDVSDTQNLPSGPKSREFDISDRLSVVHNILIIHGDEDDVVPISNAREIYEKAGEPKKMIVQRKGDHRMSYRPHQEQFIRDAVLWFQTGFSA